MCNVNNGVLTCVSFCGSSILKVPRIRRSSSLVHSTRGDFRSICKVCRAIPFRESSAREIHRRISTLAHFANHRSCDFVHRRSFRFVNHRSCDFVNRHAYDFVKHHCLKSTRRFRHQPKIAGWHAARGHSRVPSVRAASLLDNSRVMRR